LQVTVPGVGPKPARIMFCAEAPGKDEEAQELPLVGASGRLFNQMLARLGIDRTACYITNVIWERPSNNDILKFCVPKKDLPNNYFYPPVAKGKYLHPDFLTCLPRLRREIEEVQPNVIVAFGNLASWALISQTSISKVRGTVAASTLAPGRKVIPTYHPAFILRNWSDNITVLMDLRKAKFESEFPEIRRPQRTVWIEPTSLDLDIILRKLCDAPILSVDIETSPNIITCIGFARDETEAFVIPFYDARQVDGNYWRTYEEELTARQAVQFLLNSRGQKLFQNGLYDIQKLWQEGFRVRNATADTMLRHHSLYPQMKKSLGYMGSYLCNEAAWKLWHQRAGEEE
jgi:uracil-DNA glycosylase